MDVNTPAIGENGIGKETSVCETYSSLNWKKEIPALADTGVTMEISPESESPGYAKGVPIDVWVDCLGKPEAVNKGISPSDETGNSLHYP